MIITDRRPLGVGRSEGVNDIAITHNSSQSIAIYIIVSLDERGVREFERRRRDVRRREEEEGGGMRGESIRMNVLRYICRDRKTEFD